MHDLLTQLQAEMDGQICTGWVLLSEWVSSDGSKILEAHKSPELTPWSAGGMLHHALYREG